VQQRGVRGGCWGRTVLLFGFADLGVALGKFQPDRLRDVRIESHTLLFLFIDIKLANQFIPMASAAK